MVSETYLDGTWLVVISATSFSPAPTTVVRTTLTVRPFLTKVEVALKLPSDWFLWSALAAAGTSMALQAAGQRHRSLFVGQWVPALLLLGVYNKIVKVAGSDRWDHDDSMSKT